MSPVRNRAIVRREQDETDAQRITGDVDASLLDVIDNVLNQGVVLSGELVLGVAGVDLVYARISALLCAADRILPPSEKSRVRRRSARPKRRLLASPRKR